MSLDRIARQAFALFRFIQIATTILDTIQQNQNRVKQNVHHHHRNHRKNKTPRLPHTPRKE